MRFRMAAMMATLGFLPVASSRCLKAFKAGLNLARPGGHEEDARTAARPPKIGAVPSSAAIEVVRTTPNRAAIDRLGKEPSSAARRAGWRARTARAGWSTADTPSARVGLAAIASAMSWSSVQRRAGWRISGLQSPQAGIAQMPVWLLSAHGIDHWRRALTSSARCSTAVRCTHGWASWRRSVDDAASSRSFLASTPAAGDSAASKGYRADRQPASSALMALVRIRHCFDADGAAISSLSRRTSRRQPTASLVTLNSSSVDARRHPVDP